MIPRPMVGRAFELKIQRKWALSPQPLLASHSCPHIDDYIRTHNDEGHRGFVDLLDHFIAGTSGSSFPSYLSLAAVTMGLGYSSNSTNGKVTPLVDPLNQTVKQKDGSRITAYLKDGKLQTYLYEDVLTLYQGVRRGARVSNNGPMLGHRVKQADGSEPYVWLHYSEVLGRAEDVSVAFRELGIPVGNDTHIGIYSKNRPEVH
ncbi:unnamed protein product [Cylicocyclus nassatus]|uniref:AMP-dependent synthetase/ligase domain-containing protein n=1 Tax=Cylicocyclus nassatus TaxID=53992 RepID=A0AA36H3Q0_CYLNA|nr:unnamed protein product [Cylicocyclus nassatus]